jgi:hypothetical protein
MTMRSLIMLLLLAALLPGDNAAAQNLYGSPAGTVAFASQYRGQPLDAASTNLKITIDFENAELNLELDPRSIRTTTDSLNLLLAVGSSAPVIFKGKMQVANLQRKKHSVQTFKTEGLLTLNGISSPVILQTSIRHIGNAIYACQLTASFEIDLTAFNLDPGRYRIHKLLQGTISQLLLHDAQASH